MDSAYLENYLKREGLSVWRLRRLILTVRVLRLASFDPANGGLAGMEASFSRRWADAHA